MTTIIETSYSDVVTYCNNITDPTEIRRLWKILKVRHTRLAQSLAIRFNVGDNVSFPARGQTHTGVVEKINPKLIKVRVISGVIWKVTPTVLTKV
ncbi:MAG: hypothetical protein WD512_19570 [Candidatus Paceibacterota bacterium]